MKVGLHNHQHIQGQPVLGLLSLSMNRMVWALLVIISSCAAYAPVEVGTANCTFLSNCNTCLDSSENCVWCGKCEQTDDSCDTDILETCNETYYTIIFICVISGMLCICCCGCYLRRRALQGEDTLADLFSPLLPATARNYLFRNSLLGDGELEWMCIVCGFDNKPRSVHCTMCGTEHAFSQDYKVKKLEKHRQRKQRREAARLPPIKEKVDIPIPEDAQITSVSMGLKYGNTATGTVPPLPQMSMNGREALSPQKRKEAINYRRLNQLSLRQKSARRRKAWQRRVDPATGQLVWVRIPLAEVKVGSAPFGYTPRNSLDGKPEYTQSLLHSFNNDNSLNSATAGNDYIRDLLYAAEHNNLAAHSSSSSSQTGSATGGGGGGRNSRTPSSPIPYGHKRRQASKTSEDSFGDAHFVSGSPGFTSVFDEERGGLVWERVDHKEEKAALTGASRGSKDASGRSTSKARPSTFRSLFGGGGGGAAEEEEQEERRVNSLDEINRSLFSLFGASAASTGPQSMSNPVGNSSSSSGGGGGGGSSSSSTNKRINAAQMALLQEQFKAAANPQFDLEAVASLTYKEKLMWFLERTGELQVPWADGFVKIEVRRSHVLVDSFNAVMSLHAADLHKWVRIQFKDEPGVDAGGLEREWFGLLVAEIFSPSTGLFSYCGGDTATGGGAYHINPTSEVGCKQHLSYFRFVGRVLGKAIMEQQSILANLSLPLRKQIISIPITFSDLEFVDDELYRNLIWLKTNENVSNLMLDFSISYTNTAAASSSSGGSAPSQVVYELKPNGADIPVTDENKEEYLQLRLRHRMLDSIKNQLEFFLIGLYEVIPLDLLSVFDYQELDLLLCGVPDIDLTDWHRHTEYLGEYNKLGARHPVIRWFWKQVERMNHEQKVRLLQFTTGCARLPAQGFKALQSNDGKYRKFNIQSITKADSVYPRAHTCFNKLDLPLYDTETELEVYLSFIVNMESMTGFTIE